MANFCDKEDKAHSLAKRTLVKKTISSIIPRYVNDLSLFQSSNYVMNYFDGFSGRGSFGAEEQIQTLDEDICKWGTPIIAIHVAVDHMNNLMQRQGAREIIENSEIEVFKSVNFFFNDADKSNIKSLEKRVDERFMLLGWKKTMKNPIHRRSFETIVEYEGSFLSKMQSIMIIFSTFKFEEIPFLADLPAPLFSLVDPCGIAQIPMASIRQLMGDGKEIFINLMVWTINR
jgi:three-Cys-motif partner protein